MAGWSGGTFTRVHDWTDDEAAGTNIEASRMDAEDDNFATGINACIHKGGQNAATANLPMGGYIHTGVGDATALTHYPSVKQVQNGAFCYAVSSGTNTVTLTLSPAATAYAAGQHFVFKAGGTNTGATTLNVNGVGAKNVYVNGSACVGSEIISGLIYVVVYDGTQFQLVNPTFDLCCRATLSSDETIATATPTTIPWDAAAVDYGDFWSSGAATRLTIPRNGIYTISGMIKWDANATGSRGVAVSLNGGIVSYGGQDSHSNDASLSTHCSFVCPDVSLSAADYLEVEVYQDSGGNLNVDDDSCVSIRLVRAL